MLVIQMRQKEKFWWDAFGVVVFLGEEQGNEIMRGLRWWVTRQPKGQPDSQPDSGVAGRQAGRSEAAGISPASSQPVYSSRPPSSFPRRRRRDGEIAATDDHSISPPPTPIMKLITATLLSALSCYTELAAAATGRVITLDPSLSSHEHSTTQQDTLSPETARLVIAQRAGLEDYHVDKALNEKEINAINAHGLQTSRLSKDNTERVFILAFVDEEDAEGMPGQHFLS